MKYPDTRQAPLRSRMGVTVSTACFLFSNDVPYWMTTYAPSGAPGSEDIAIRDTILRATTLPSGVRSVRSVFRHCSFWILE